MKNIIFSFALINIYLTLSFEVDAQDFDFKKYLFDPSPTLSINLESLNKTSGEVVINGVDLGDLQQPDGFGWDWGDGSAIEYHWFAHSHTYINKNINYIVKVTAYYSGGETDVAEVLVRFVSPTISPVTLSDIIPVYIPDNNSVLSTLGTRLYAPPGTLTYFDNSFFPIISRSNLEYVLSVAAQIQKDFVNDNFYLFNGKFEQYMFRDPTFGGAYSLWFTDPVSFGVGDPFMLGNIDYSSLFHEMGHNTTLNTPAAFYYGDIIGGNANAIYSESMAQIFQHATGYEIVNDYEDYGLSEDLMFEIKQQIIRTIKFVRYGYDQYILEGKPFASWNDPSTPEDETMWTFLTIAYKFCEHAENGGEGYLLPLKRMMTLLQGLSQEWADSYDRLNNNIAADEFRATLMVRAISDAFEADLRDEFTELNFPVSDDIYNALPVELTSFTGILLTDRILLNWETATEVISYGFEIERKSEVGGWLNIGFVQGYGNSNSPKSYSYEDKNLNGGSKFKYRLKQIDTDGKFNYSNIIEIKLMPKGFVLYQNYPNPFNPSTKISWQSPVSSRQVLEVFDVLGNVIATLVDEEKEAGYHSIDFNGNDLSSGFYFYRINAGNPESSSGQVFIDTKKMIFLK